MVNVEAAGIAAELDRWQAEQDQKTAAVLDSAKAMVPSSIFMAIQAYLADCGYTDDFSIVPTPTGQQQPEEDYAFGFSYVDQICNGGMTGDEFSGVVCLPLSADAFLRFRYYM